MLRYLSALLVVLAASPAVAEGFANDDLTTVPVDTAAYEGGAFEARATAPERLTIFCLDCEGFTAIDVLIGQGDPGTERRLRSGETTVADMEALCRERAPSCRIEAASVGEAIGYRSVYGSTGGAGSTAVLMLDGAMLTIRSIAPDAETASANAETALDAIAPAVVVGD